MTNVSSTEEDVYEIEEIVKDRIVNGKKQYFIKWVGYPSSDNTWEDADNIYSEDLKNEYEARKTKKVKKTPVATKAPKFTVKVTNEWANTVKKVVGVYKDANCNLQVEYETIDGKKAISDCKEMHIKAPIHLLKFYEENLSFPE